MTVRPSTLRALGALVLGLMATGCAGTTKRLPDYASGLRTGAACVAAREQAHATVPPSTILPPQAVEVFLPPLPVPEQLKGRVATITVRVDSAGYPRAETIQVTGVEHAAYVARMRSQVQKTRYRPASLEGCAVEGTARFTYEFAK